MLVVLVALVVGRPLVAGDGQAEPATDERRAALDAEKEAKYREIHDAELDFRMGKMSEADYRKTDRELRTQAIAILRRIDALDGEGADGR